MKLSERATLDLVVLALVFIVGTVLLMSALAIILIELFHPESDTDAIIEAEAEMLAVLIGALVGFVGGRAAGRSEAATNGTH